MPALISWWTLDVEQLAPAAHNDAVLAVGKDLLNRLVEPHRHYHTMTHVVEMFWALEDLEQAGHLSDREGVLARIATWFHDAVYEVGGTTDNEGASAALARDALSSLGLRTEDVARVHDLVRLTTAHEAPAHDPLAQAFLDADLWILSAPPERFDAYCEQVRKEYAVVPAAVYAAARSRILEGLVRRDTLYATGHARAEWEPRAKANVARELTRLAGRLQPR